MNKPQKPCGEWKKPGAKRARILRIHLYKVQEEASRTNQCDGNQHSDCL